MGLRAARETSRGARGADGLSQRRGGGGAIAGVGSVSAAPEEVPAVSRGWMGQGNEAAIVMGDLSS